MFGINQSVLTIRLQDSKLFFVGMCIVLLAEIFLDHSWYKKSCVPNYRNPSKITKESYFGTVNVSYAKHLASTIHVYCFILTEPNQLKIQLHTQNTWVRRCTDYAFISPGTEDGLKILDAGHTNAYYSRTSWNSMRLTLKAIYAVRGENMYFLKADQSDYMIMENLRYMLEFEDPNVPFIIGHLQDPHSNVASLAGSAGYVISRQALNLIVTKGLPSVPACAENSVTEDVQIGLCAQAVGVQVRDSFDFLGKSRFTNVSIFDIVGPYPNNTPRWYPQETDYTMPTYNLSKLPASPLLVSMTGIEGVSMYVMEYLLYHLRAVGIKHQWFPSPPANRT